MGFDKAEFKTQSLPTKMESSQSGIKELDTLITKLEHDIDVMKRMDEVAYKEIAEEPSQKVIRTHERQEYARAMKELGRYKWESNCIGSMLDCSLPSLIPSGLNDELLAKYGRLFDGYYRETHDGNMMPMNVTRLISLYFPLFL